jgi:surface protein
MENYITIKYKIKKDNNQERIKIFGNKFIYYNSNELEIEINKKRDIITSFYKGDLDDNGELEVKLFGFDKITNMNYMFDSCKSIEKLEISDINTSNITCMKSVFHECSSLIFLPDISKWDTKNVTDMNFMFQGCNSLLSFPDISKWNVGNLKNMTCMFCNCSSISKLPDISIWNTQNAEDMSNMFENCMSLARLPDFSKWNLKNVCNMSNMLKNCYSLVYLPEFSKTKNARIGPIVPYCISLLDFPNKDENNNNYNDFY